MYRNKKKTFLPSVSAIFKVPIKKYIRVLLSQKKGDCLKYYTVTLVITVSADWIAHHIATTQCKLK